MWNTQDRLECQEQLETTQMRSIVKLLLFKITFNSILNLLQVELEVSIGLYGKAVKIKRPTEETVKQI